MELHRVDESVHLHQRHDGQHDDAPGREARGDVGDLLGWRNAEGQEERAGRHQEQFTAVGVGPAVILVHAFAAEQSASQHRPEAGGHGLDRDFADRIGDRGVHRDQAEEQQHEHRGAETDAIGDEGVQHIVPPLEGRLEARVKGQGGQHRHQQQHQKQEFRAIDGEAKPPHLHRHQQGQRKDDRAARSSTEPDQVAMVVAHGSGNANTRDRCVLVAAMESRRTPPDLFSSPTTLHDCRPTFAGLSCSLGTLVRSVARSLRTHQE